MDVPGAAGTREALVARHVAHHDEVLLRELVAMNERHAIILTSDMHKNPRHPKRAVATGSETATQTDKVGNPHPSVIPA